MLQAVLGEAKAVGDGPTAENGGDKLRFKRIRVELASVAPIGAISHGWAEWVPGSIGWARTAVVRRGEHGLWERRSWNPSWARRTRAEKLDGGAGDTGLGRCGSSTVSDWLAASVMAWVHREQRCGILA